MKKYFAVLLLLLTIQTGHAQGKKLWKGYFGYKEIKDLTEGTNKITAVSENALFSKDLTNGSVKTLTTIDGLSGQTITSLYHSIAFKKTLVGYQNGLMIIINDADGNVLNVVDIINKTISPDIKKINHFNEYEGIVYISCDFGIVQYNLNIMQFGDTYFIGNNGAQIAVKQTAVFQNKIYAATPDQGMKFADINNPNLNDFSQWATIDNNWGGVERIDDKLVGVNTVNVVYRIQGTNLSPLTTLTKNLADIRANNNYLLITSEDKIYIYNSNLAQVRILSNTEIQNETDVKFTCAMLVGDTLYIGTLEHGLYVTRFSGGTYENITPLGPERNNIFAISVTPKDLWAVYGGYNKDYDPYRYIGITPTQFGISKYSSGIWNNIPYEEVLGAKALSRVTINPANDKQVYVSSFFSGLLKVENDVPTTLYNNTNSGLEIGQNATDIRINGTAFDAAGNLWVTNSMTKNGLKVLKANGQWGAYDLSSVIKAADKLYMGKLTIDKNGTKWIPTRDDGLIAFNETYGQLPKSMTDKPDKGELPSEIVNVAAVDKRDQLWIGTNSGLRVLSSVDAFLSEAQMVPENIVIVENNTNEELFFQQPITDIVVDGANNKWVGTLDAGVFYVSSDGQRTIYAFNQSNSPLPSNNVNDIDINSATGEVFFATDKGMISFSGISTAASDNLENVYIYPNPVRPEYYGTVKISGLMDQANVKIADISGNLVYEAIAEGGTIEWDTSAFGKYKVASGVYMVLISSKDGVETKVKKVMIVR